MRPRVAPPRYATGRRSSNQPLQRGPDGTFGVIAGNALSLDEVHDRNPDSYGRSLLLVLLTLQTQNFPAAVWAVKKSGLVSAHSRLFSSTPRLHTQRAGTLVRHGVLSRQRGKATNPQLESTACRHPYFG